MKQENVLSDFRIFLESRSYSASTISITVFNVGAYLKSSFCSTSSSLSRRRVLSHLYGLWREGKRSNTVGKRLRSLALYGDYLVSIGKQSHNVLSGLKVHFKSGIRQYVLFSSEELASLYDSWPASAHRSSLTYKVMLGLVVYQGLSSHDLKYLEAGDIDLEKCLVCLRHSRRLKSRDLSLRAVQILALSSYLNESRPVLLSEKKTPTNQLLMPSGRGLGHGYLLDHLLKGLRCLSRDVVSLHQLRASVISNWIGEHHLRKVQYMSGHYSVSTTEQYKREDIRILQSSVNNYHPLR